MIISGGIFEKNEVKKKLDLISKETSKENFWKDQKKVKNILKEKKFFDFLISSYQNLVKDIKNIEDLHSLGNEEQNEEKKLTYSQTPAPGRTGPPPGPHCSWTRTPARSR